MNPLLKKFVPSPLAQSLRRVPILRWAADRLHLTTGGSAAVSDEEYRRRLGAHLAARGKLYPAPEPGVGFSVLTTVYEGTHADYFLETARSPLTSPFAGLHKTDPGYYAQALKARPCSGVNPLFFLADTRFLREALARLPEVATLAGLGAWLGAMAAGTGRRVAFSPLISGLCAEPGRVAEPMKTAKRRAFRERYGTLVSAQNLIPAGRPWPDCEALRARVS